ncbi:S8 family serine peptidase [Streptomyces sp. B-S-A12]|uniref:S8 family serine peptidase n=1 Tax=Streptomyces luteolus TaxID=3043615 RepID=A0ABT6SRF6_9ACTN|nr:S8 family serine peptidase [Streptomyces sp. B-S-A12]MDI3417950.1 S8 family serine peptidase [Streptomyces sp. B-S-A12]
MSTTEESSHGRHVDLSGPGDEMVNACAGNSGLCESHGTSGAAAIASASAALIWSKHPDWTNNQVLRVLVDTAGGRGQERQGANGLRRLRRGPPSCRAEEPR